MRILCTCMKTRMNKKVHTRHSQNRHFVALRCFAAHLLRLQDAMLIFLALSSYIHAGRFHARQKKAHKNVRVNCNISVNIALRSA